MKHFLHPNIGTRGRLIRGLGGAGFLGGAILAYRMSPWPAVGMAIAGLFMLFEAARGWCVLRACGVKTRV